MRKLINTAGIYTILAMICGVFYREFTKILGFSGKTTLAVTHLHFMVLGAIMFLILALFCINSNFLEQKNFKKFYFTYNIALPFMVIMFMVRGVLQVLEIPLSKGLNASISGVAGISHITMCIALYFLFSCLRNINISANNTVKH